MIKVALADDHGVVREGLVRIIQSTGDMQVCLCASNGGELLERLADARPDVVLLDLSMPGLSGMDLLREVRRGCPRCSVLVLSMYPANQYAVKSLAAGAAGYLSKGEPPSEIVRAIRAAASGARHLTAEVSQLLAANVAMNRNRAPHEVLSDREYVVLRMLAQGRFPGEIAAELGLSIKTISTFRLRIRQKLGLGRTAELVRYALDHGLVD